MDTNDHSVPLCSVVAGLLWAWVAGLIALGWLALAMGAEPVAVMTGLTACASSAVAAVMHLRCYFVRQSRLVRAIAREVQMAQEPGGIRSL